MSALPVMDQEVLKLLFQMKRELVLNFARDGLNYGLQGSIGELCELSQFSGMGRQ
ncbi:hypothetical protein [Arthrobacter sp. YN]|uniref:hypothetical protein n=1 Tax=Arthrobacter sp. YN TaxID=2020486 RepID=UPI0012FDDABE|nr:hypothetical protein [Arthrobacter sp. YN]